MLPGFELGQPQRMSSTGLRESLKLRLFVVTLAPSHPLAQRDAPVVTEAAHADSLS